MKYVFEGCELDTQLYALRRGGRKTHLSPKVYAVLTYLIENRDRVVTRQDLCDYAWPGQFISDATLGSTMRAVRMAIGDNGQRQRMIRTQRGHGYRFVAAVETVQSEERPAEARVPVVSGVSDCDGAALIRPLTAYSMTLEPESGPLWQEPGEKVVDGLASYPAEDMMACPHCHHEIQMPPTALQPYIWSAATNDIAMP